MRIGSNRKTFYRARIRGLPPSEFSIEGGDFPRPRLPSDLGEGEEVLSLRIRRPLRFGNAIQALSHSIEISRKIGAKQIFAPGLPIKTGVVEGILISAESAPETVCLSGDFFKVSTLKDFHIRRDNSLQPTARIRKLVQLYGLTPSRLPKVEPYSLVIHIRSGDVFESKPHPSYGQPPLAFYLAVIEQITWAKVHLVFENFSNPVVGGLISELSRRLIPFELHSSTVVEDLRIVMAARNLVGSKGTFLYPALVCSRKVRTLYLWENYLPTWVKNRKLRVRHFGDKSGTYGPLVTDHWKNTPQQRTEMLTFDKAFVEEVL